MAPSAELTAALRALAAREMAADSAHDLAHLDRVWIACQRIVAGEGRGDPRLLVAGAYLHDLVNLPKSSPARARASRLAAEAAAARLPALGYAPVEIGAIRHIIESHSFSAGIEPETAEAEILRDADRLDALGAIGIARNFAVAGQTGQALYHPNDPFAANRSLDDTRYALDHWRLKLLGLADGLRTRTARCIAEERIALMQAFLDELALEIGRPLPDGWRVGPLP
ncbi:putative hydrolase [Pseudoruegeria aquimaris]|uniref:Putative hydrolase n=1 Tax=Pseudoruegeria aquimaris TaxID=393663 RepID=A0A1Y5RYT3_9RHOB|nr:HD domain-containing protein [Pseudoruegeria aquimaris]SLN28093.1 putative hydrolase [Pseudoruegeria aquimaris]